MYCGILLYVLFVNYKLCIFCYSFKQIAYIFILIFLNFLFQLIHFILDVFNHCFQNFCFEYNFSKLYVM